MNKICEVCGEKFEAKRSDAKYCSKKCRQNKSVRNKRGSFAKKECIICHKDISKLKNGSVYCKECGKVEKELDRNEYRRIKRVFQKIAEAERHYQEYEEEDMYNIVDIDAWLED